MTAAIRWAVGTRQFGIIERQDSLGRYVQTISKGLPSPSDPKDSGVAVSAAEQVERAGMLFGNLCDVEQLDGCSLGLGPPPPSVRTTDRDDVGEDTGKATKETETPGDWWMPPLMAQAGITNPGISLGPSRAGLPWHNHDAAWQAVVRGASADSITTG